jgi:putative transposase
MRRSFKFLLRPTVGQAQSLGEMLRDHRSLYNGALENRRGSWRDRKLSVSYGTQSAQLSEIRAFDPERQGRWSFSSQQATLRRLDAAFAAFFRRVKADEKPGYPRFKGAGQFEIVTWPTNGNGCRWDSTSASGGATRCYFKGVGHVRVHQHRSVRGRIKTVTVKREGRRWYVVLSCDDVPAQPLPATGAVAGIDLGIASFLTTSDGEHVANPRHARKAAEKLAAAQQALSRCKRGSNRRKKVRTRVTAAHRKARLQRWDHAHKTALRLVRDYDLIAHEDLRIANMVRTPKPKPDPDQPGVFLANGAAAKAGLNRSICDAGWGVFLAILAAKAESAGRILIAVDPRNTSRTCPACGHAAKENRVTQEKFRCVACGHTAHADVVGAINVLRAGLARREALTG